MTVEHEAGVTGHDAAPSSGVEGADPATSRLGASTLRVRSVVQTLGRIGDPVRDILFPQASTRSVNRLVVAALYVAAAVAAFEILLQWGGSSLHVTSRIWAEDGTIFLGQAYDKSFLGVLFKPYAGYMHSVPRVIAELTTLLPVRDAAGFMAVASVAVRVATALFVFRASSGFFRSTIVRAMLGCVVVLLPVAGLETLDNVANLHWFMTFAAFWALLWRPARRWECALAALVVTLAITSDPVVALFAPLVLLRVLALRRWRDHLVSLAFLVGGIAQGLAILAGDRGAHESFGPIGIARYYSVRVLVGPLGGYTHTRWLFGHWGWFAVGLGAVVTIALLLPALLTGGSARWLAVTCVLAAMAVFGLSWHDLRVLPHTHLDLITSVPRYDVIPSLLMITAIAVALDRLPLRKPHFVWSVALQVAVAAVFLSALVPDLQASRRYWVRSDWKVPTWATAVRLASSHCPADRSGKVGVAIEPPGWYVLLPCRDAPVAAGQGQ